MNRNNCETARQKESKNMNPPNGEVVISARSIEQRIVEMGWRIDTDFKGEELVVLPVLKGGMIFASDLIRQLQLDVRVDFIQVSSYKGTSSVGVVNFLTKPRLDLKGKNVLIVEDIIDTGKSMAEVCPQIQSLGPKTLKVVSFLDKPAARKVEFVPDYFGFAIQPTFVVGYGLDCDEKYRNLPDVWVLDSAVIE
jgi:hypoxanthine phosphoribosyltransferase